MFKTGIHESIIKLSYGYQLPGVTVKTSKFNCGYPQFCSSMWGIAQNLIDSFTEQNRTLLHIKLRPHAGGVRACTYM